MSETTRGRALIAGASFAGLSSAHWLSELGYDVTVVEVAPALRTGGTAVDIKGGTVDVARRMGVLDAIRADRLSLKRWEMKGADDRTERTLVLRGDEDPPPDDEFEVERSVLLRILFARVRDRCEVTFGDKIASLRETAGGVDVTFAKGAPRAYDLVLGCDGVHSDVRAMTFGPEADYARYLGVYFSITIVDELLIERDTAQMFNVPGKAVMLNAHKGQTDIVLCFASEREVSYDRRDEAAQREIIRGELAGVGWRVPELLGKVDGSASFYFDKLCQVRMPAWSKGRVVLVGDSAYCPSPAAGLGGSLAIDGAAALADAMRAHPDDYARAFGAYEASFRPFVEAVQDEAVRTGLETLVPRTEEAIRARNAKTDAEF